MTNHGNDPFKNMIGGSDTPEDKIKGIAPNTQSEGPQSLRQLFDEFLSTGGQLAQDPKRAREISVILALGHLNTVKEEGDELRAQGSAVDPNVLQDYQLRKLEATAWREELQIKPDEIPPEYRQP